LTKGAGLSGVPGGAAAVARPARAAPVVRLEAVMQDDTWIKVGLIFALLVFLGCGAYGFVCMSKVGSETEEKDCLVKQIRALREKRDTHKLEIEKLRLEALERKIDTDLAEWQGRIVKGDSKRLDSVQKTFQKLKEMRRAVRAHLTRLRGEVSDKMESGDSGDPGAKDRGQGQSIDALRKDQNLSDAEYTEERNRLKTIREDLERDVRREKLRYDGRYEERVKGRSGLETEYAQIKEELRRYMVREPLGPDKSYDGVVLTFDIRTGQVEIDIGERHGVRRGMRFEVFQLRQGERRVHKGYIVVRDVAPELSDCQVFDRDVSLPSCPGCGYTGRLPEERFCPYCAGGGSAAGTKFQQLSGLSTKTTLGMKQHEPIIVGDLLHNPLFAPGRKLRIAVKGDQENPVHPDFPFQLFVNAVRRHGNILDEEVGAQTDLLLAGKFAQAHVRKARELGLRILHHSEVFNFLRY
jgi:hypothetical protein